MTSTGSEWTNAIRETGGVFGVAILATVFASSGSYASPQEFTDGLRAAVPIGAAVLALGALVGLLTPGRLAAAVGRGGAGPSGTPTGPPRAAVPASGD